MSTNRSNVRRSSRGGPITETPSENADAVSGEEVPRPARQITNIPEAKVASKFGSTSSPSRYNRELTGSHRVLNDTIVDFYRTVFDWTSKQLAGLEAVGKLREASRSTKQYADSCTIIRQNLDEMKLLVAKLNAYSDRLDNLAKLHGAETEKPYSLSWGYKEFAKCAKHITDVYSAETDMKYAITLKMLTKSPDYALVSVIWDTAKVKQVSSEFETMLYEAKLK